MVKEKVKFFGMFDKKGNITFKTDKQNTVIIPKKIIEHTSRNINNPLINPSLIDKKLTKKLG